MNRAGSAEAAALVLAAVAALLYNVWPIGFLLDPAAVHGTYLSVLEVPGRPDAGLFLTCDVLSGLLALGAALLLRRHPRPAAGVALFGAGTVLEAAIPIAAACVPSVAACGIAPGQVLAPHDLASLLSAAGLAQALVAVRARTAWTWGLLVLWAVTGLVLVAAVVTAQRVIAAQAAFLVASGVALVGVPLALIQRSPAQATRSSPR